MVDELDVGITLDRRIDTSGSISPFDDRWVESTNNKMAKLKEVHFVLLILIAVHLLNAFFVLIFGTYKKIVGSMVLAVSWIQFSLSKTILIKATRMILFRL